MSQTPAKADRLAVCAFAALPVLHRRSTCCLVAALATGTLLGCGGHDGPQRYQISGAVTFDGRPVPFGSIVFEPDTAAGNSGPQGAAMIIDGRYDTGVQKGLVGGPHVIRIDGNDAMPTQTAPSIKRLFDTYELRESLPKENITRDFTVPAPAGKRAKSTAPEQPLKKLRPEQQP